MPYNHDHGISTPTVELSFSNQTRKSIVRANFRLIVTGPEGEKVPYDENLSFSEEPVRARRSAAARTSK